MAPAPAPPYPMPGLCARLLQAWICPSPVASQGLHEIQPVGCLPQPPCSPMLPVVAGAKPPAPGLSWAAPLDSWPRVMHLRPNLQVLKGHDDHVITCLQFCGNRIVSGSDDNTLKVWSAVTGEVSLPCQGATETCSRRC